MIRRVAPLAYFLCLLALASGCGSPSSATPQNGTTAVSGQIASGNSATSTAVAPGEAASGDAHSKFETPSSGGVRLSGSVKFDGVPPERRVINTSKDAACAKLHDGKPVLDEDLIVSTAGGVKNAFVFVRRGAPTGKYAVPEEPATLEQQGCMFRPRVQGMRAGQRLKVGNGDPVTHNVRSFPVINQAFNFGQPPDTPPRERLFEQAEREIEIQCDIHPWMHAYLFVMDHPFFNVTDDDGAFAIEGLPPGEYTLESWHEKLGKQRTSVTVGSDPLVDVNFAYRP
jgi:hypothetical protein